MSRSDRDVTRVVRSWLDEGVTALPDRVLDAVLDELPATPQRRSWGTARRFPIMNNALRVGLAAAAVIIAVIAINLMPGTPAPGIAPSPTLEPTIAAAPTATPVPAALHQNPLDPGRYRLDAGLTTDVTIEVPSGWSANDGWVLIGPRGNDEPDGMAIRFYTIPNLAANPLSYGDGNLDPPVGPTVDDLVEAIVDHPGWTARDPTDITIDGRAGQLLTITIPPDVELAGVDRFYLWADPTGGGIYGWSPGQTFDWYIVDVDGQRLIIDAFHYPDTSEEDLTAQRVVVESVQFD